MQNSVPLAKDEVQGLQRTHSQEMPFSKDGNAQSGMHNEPSFRWEGGIYGKFIDYSEYIGCKEAQRPFYSTSPLLRGMCLGWKTWLSLYSLPSVHVCLHSNG